ncbi:MAG: zinc transport system rane protein TroD [Planctomycetota bacterium]
MNPAASHDLLRELLQFDVPVLASALLALVACATMGNWLVLRKESMTGDAIAHAVLPGIVAGFLVTGRHSLPAMFLGAAVAGATAIVLANLVQRRTRLEAGAGLGIVFSAFFALGVALLETQGARQVDLDPGCVLFGSLETLFLAPPPGGHWYEGIAHETWVLAAAALVVAGLSVLFAKELAALCFDREHARTTGIAPRALEPAMLFVTSLAIVASFEAVGSLLVIALLACPSLIAAPHANSLRARFAISLAVGGLLLIGGYMLAAHAPAVLGTDASLNAAGMISTVLAAAVPLSFAVARWTRRPLSRPAA